MRRSTFAGLLGAASFLAATLVVAPDGARPVLGQGVGGATWTPASSSTTAMPSRFLLSGDSITYRTEAVWDTAQARGLARYEDDGLRYTLEANDRSGRLSATGYWATNLPDPAYDRDDDDGDRRWEEAEIVAGKQGPKADHTYTTSVQFSRWYPKRVKGVCEWAWDRRRGSTEILSQLSRDLFGEWQAERYTLTYETLPYERVEVGPPVPQGASRARCRDADPGVNQSGYTITFSRPLSWSEFRALVSAGVVRWTAWEAVGSSAQDKLVWTCGGPADDVKRLGPCRALGMSVDGVSAAVGYLDDIAVSQLRAHDQVVSVEGLRDPLTGLLYDFGGFGVERPGLTVNDRYWDLVLAD